MNTWLPIHTAPHDGTFVLVAGPSGYGSTPLRVEVCRYLKNEPHVGGWRNHANDWFMDGGEDAQWWAPIPEIPTPPVKRPVGYAQVIGRSKRYPKVKI